MSRLWTILLLTLLSLAIVGCGVGNTISLNTEEPPPSTQATPPEIDANIITLARQTFRAEVLEFEAHLRARAGEPSLFVSSITPVLSSEIGGRYIVRLNDSTIVLDVYGELISYDDILPGAIVAIEYSGVFMMRPGIIGAYSIQVVE